MTARPHRMSPPARRWTVVLGLSAVLHVAVLTGLAFRSPTPPKVVALTVIDVSLAPRLPFARPAPKPASRSDAPPVRSRAIILPEAPRYVSAARADTGDTSAAVDLFGPVFADGLWPRPVVVRAEACDPHEPTDAGDACRRELMLIGLATGGAAGAKAQP